MSEDIECPYCGSEQEINHDDGYGYEENQTYHQQCDQCYKTFTFTTSIFYIYESEKVDCLNGGKHKFKQSHTVPKIWSRMVCTNCGEDRQPTNKEWNKILSKEEIAKAKSDYPNNEWIQNL